MLLNLLKRHYLHEIFMIAKVGQRYVFKNNYVAYFKAKILNIIIKMTRLQQ